MTRISYKRHRFPPAVIQHAVWLYFRFTLSLRDVEEMLAHLVLSFYASAALRSNSLSTVGDPMGERWYRNRT